jgi:hypothetical protein
MPATTYWPFSRIAKGPEKQKINFHQKNKNKNWCRFKFGLLFVLVRFKKITADL